MRAHQMSNVNANPPTLVCIIMTVNNKDKRQIIKLNRLSKIIFHIRVVFGSVYKVRGQYNLAAHPWDPWETFKLCSTTTSTKSSYLIRRVWRVTVCHVVTPSLPCEVCHKDLILRAVTRQQTPHRKDKRPNATFWNILDFWLFIYY